MFLTKRFGAFILVCFIAALVASIVLVRADDSAAAAAVPAATPTPTSSAVAAPTTPPTPTATATATPTTAPTPTATATATPTTAPTPTATAVATPAPLRREGLIAPAAPEPSEATDLTAPPAPGLVLDDVQSQPTAEPEPTPALEPTAAPVLAPTAAPTTVVAAPWHVRRGEAALAQIPFNLSSLGYTISFHPERSSHRGLTFTKRNHIEIYVRATMSDAELVYVIAHEMGHAADVMRTSYADRDAWFSARGIPRTTAWWPSGIGNDLATPAGDFAECFASWAVGSASHSHYGSCAGTGPLVQQIIAR